jgi:pyrroline-5-carboxylate reductase
MSKVKVVMVGAGHLGSLILAAWIKRKIFPQNKIHVHVKSKKTLLALKKKFPKLSLGSSEAGDSLPNCEMIVIAVKPQQWNELKNSLEIKSGSLLLSIMAGIPPSRLENETGAPSIVAMTNTAIQVGEAITSLYKSKSCSDSALAKAKKLFEPFGMVAVLDEKHFAAATAYGGSHPAFAIWILNELSKIISTGLGTEEGMAWTLQVFKGAGKLIQKNKNVNELLTQITTPGGCTAEGLRALEELDVSGKLSNAFESCIRKAEKLGDSK